MNKRIGIFIVNYNMPERTESLANHIRENVRWPYHLYIIDNASDIIMPARGTNVSAKRNLQTTGGWLLGLQESDKRGEDYLGYWFIITSAEFMNNTDVLTPMAQFFVDTPGAVGVHPALSPDSTTTWEHLKTRGTGAPRRTWMIDNIMSLWRASWFNKIGRFDSGLKYGWGIDLETCYLARQQGYSLWVHERVTVKKITDIGYTMNRMNMSAQERRVLASANMNAILSQKYGQNWFERLTGEYIEGEWK